MSTTRFTLRHGPAAQRFWSNVVVYDTVDELRKAAYRHHPDKNMADCMGCFQFRPGPTRYLGIMRLCREHLTPEIVIHEAVHAAVAYVWKLSGKDRINLDARSQGDSTMGQREEELAYAVHGISAALLKEFELVP